MDRYKKDGRGNLAALGVEAVRELYWTEGMSMRAIGRRVGVHPQAVNAYMMRHGIPTRPKINH